MECIHCYKELEYKRENLSECLTCKVTRWYKCVEENN